MLSETTPAGVNAIFERFRNILHDGKIEKRIQYTIEKLFQVRKVNFKNNPGVVPELDLIEEADRITHNVSLDDEFIEELNLDKFKFDPNFAQQEAQWDEIKKEILGEYFENLNKAAEQEEEEEDHPLAIDR